MIKKTKEFILENSFESLKNFLSRSQLGLKSFRYFQKREYDVILSHIYTCLYFVGDECVGYGHLDPHDNKIWLGIIVRDDYVGNGYGNLILNDLKKQTNDNIYLSVDKDNLIAINLYKKNGFEFFSEEDYYVIMVNKQKNKKKWQIP